MFIAEIGPIGAIPVIGPIVLGVIGIVDLITSILGISFGSGELKDIVNAINQLQGALSAAVNQITAAWWTLAYAFGKLLQWVHDAFTGFLTTLWQLLKKIAGWITQLAKEVIPKILNLVKRLRQLLDQIYLKYIRPLLVWIQYARQWLALLRLFHIGWANKLDQWLATLQGRIIAPFLYVLRAVNGIGSWVNFILTAQGIIQRGVFINTMYAYQSDWIPMWWTGQTASSLVSPPGTGALPPSGPSLSQVSSTFTQWVSTDTGDYATAAARSQAAFDAAMNGSTGIL